MLSGEVSCLNSLFLNDGHSDFQNTQLSPKGEDWILSSPESEPSSLERAGNHVDFPVFFLKKYFYY